MQNNTKNQVYAGFFVRLAAYLIDWVIVGAALLLIRLPIWIASVGGAADFVLQDFIFQYSIYDIVLYILKVAYFALLTYFTGATLGKRLLHISVISAEDRKPTFFEIVFRESVGKFLSALIINAGYFMIGLDKQKRGLHDMLSDTYVVYSHEKKVAVPTPVVYQTVRYAAPVQTPQYQQPNQFVQQTALNQPMQNQPVQSQPMQQASTSVQSQPLLSSENGSEPKAPLGEKSEMVPENKN